MKSICSFYDLEFSANDHPNSTVQFEEFIQFLLPQLHIYDGTIQLPHKPIYRLFMEEDMYHSDDRDERSWNVLKEFLIYEYEKSARQLRTSLFITPTRENDHEIFESWLIHISHLYPLIHIKLHYYHQKDGIYDDEVFYVHMYHMRLIESYDKMMEDYYLNKHGKTLLNQGFFLLYPIYQELIHDNPDYYKNYESRFYQILRDPRLMYQHSSQNQLFESLIHPKYRHCRPLFYQFQYFLDQHTAIRDMLIDETTRMIGKYKERPLIYFQSWIKYKLQLRKVCCELREYAYLPPYSREEFERAFEGSYKLIYGRGGGLYQELHQQFYQK